MKKSLFILIAAVSFTIGPTSLQARTPSERVAHNISRQAAQQSSSAYADKRVKEMCNEWPGCKEWASERVRKNSSFRIVDTEVERYVVGWARSGAVWQYKFYVQTTENGQKKAYAFERELNENEWTYPSPSQIKKFPGHPKPNKPSKHVKQEDSSTPQATCKWFTPCANWLKSHYGSVKRARFSQYVHFNTNGDAVWNRDLYVLVQVHFEDKMLRFHSYQTRPGGSWKYQASPGII